MTTTDEKTAFEIELEEIDKRCDWIESILREVAESRRVKETEHDDQS